MLSFYAYDEANNVARCFRILVFHRLCVVVELVVPKEAVEYELNLLPSFSIKRPRLIGRY